MIAISRVSETKGDPSNVGIDVKERIDVNSR